MVGLTPNEIQAVANSSGVGTATPLPVKDCLAGISSTSDSGLRRDAAKEPMVVAIKQTACTEAISAKVKTVTKAKNGKTICESDIDKIIVETEVGGNKANEVNNNKTAVEVGNDKCSGKLKDDKIPQVRVPADSLFSLSEHSATFVKTNSATASLLENSAVNIAKDCATVSGNIVTSELHTVVTDSNPSVCAVQSKPKDKKTETTLPPDALHPVSLSKVTTSSMLPVTCDIGVSASEEVCTNSADPETAVTETEGGLNGVKVKQEQPSEYDDADLSVFARNGEERLQQTEDMSTESEVMPYIIHHVFIHSCSL